MLFWALIIPVPQTSNACGAQNFRARKNFNWNVYVPSIPIDWSKKKDCHAHSYAHKPTKPLVPTIFLLD